MRTLTEAMTNALVASTLRPALFLYFETAAKNYYYWTGPGKKSWNSLTWEGDGTFKGITEYEESDSLIPLGLEIPLSGVPEVIIAMALNDIRQGKTVKVWFAVLNESMAIVADPHLIFIGRVDKVELKDEPFQATITISAENRIITQDDSKEFRYTDASQRSFYPTDGGFKYVAQMEDWDGWWGKVPLKPKKETSSTDETKKAKKARKKKKKK